ncbi:MAG: hypothetical protein JWM05_3717, partial [Acidimicrobiales bacterium]|nr:hypothetical protein [Acidimicrobiales bacterium]
PITSYQVCQSTDPTMPTASTSCTAVPGPNSATISGLTPGVTYYFTVAATNALGTGPSTSSLGVTPYGVPAAPTSLVATAVGLTANLSWTPPTDTGGAPITSYQICRSTDPAIPTSTMTCQFVVGPATATVTGLVGDTTYYFNVVAVNRAGAGPKSNVASAYSSVKPDGSAPVASLKVASRWTLSTTVGASWSATDLGSGVKSFDVTRRSAGFSGQGWSTSAAWFAGTTKTSGSFTGNAGSTYCLRARARDNANNVGHYTAELCTAIPLRVTQMSFSGPWKKTVATSVYGGTSQRSSSRGASFNRTKVVGSRLALIATKCSTCGAVSVYWNGVLKTIVSLKATATKTKQIVDLPTFSASSGTVRIAVATSGKPVIIEGLGISRSAS